MPLTERIAIRPKERIDLSNVIPLSINTDGGILKAGTASSRIVGDIANMKFISIYTDNGAASGDNRGIYNRLYLTGGGGGESLRSMTTVEDVTAGTAHGSHLSLSFGSTGKITGLGVAGRNTLHIPNQAMSGGGTYASVQAEIWSDGANSDPAGMTELSFLRCVNGGNASGIADVEDDAFFAVISGGAVASGNMFQAKSSAAVSHVLKMKAPDGNTYYFMMSNAV